MKGRNFSMSAAPTERIKKIATPGSGGGNETMKPNAETKQMGKMSGRTAPARAARAGNSPKARGSAKIAQGGTSADGASGLSRTNKGRQKL